MYQVVLDTNVVFAAMRSRNGPPGNYFSFSAMKVGS
jgi:predicted nucleic acid-binding protein